MLFVAVDATNGRNNSLVVVYKAIANITPAYVRDQKEFCEKFELIIDKK